MSDARDRFFAAAVSAEAGKADNNAASQLSRLEHTVVKEALKAGGCSQRLKILEEECRDEFQLEAPGFCLEWFAAHYPDFPAKLIVGLAPYSGQIGLLDFLENPRKSPQFNAYADAVARTNTDDKYDKVCCIFRCDSRLYCINNFVVEPFRNAVKSSMAAVLLRTPAGDMCLQRYQQFLQVVGNNWCNYD